VKLDEFRNRKGKEKIIMLTAYDYQIAKILDEERIDMILVGDSLGMVVQGYMNTKSVTMEDMLYHTKVVARGAKNTPIIGDMPLNSDNTAEDALRNAKAFLDAGAHGVKIEGNKTDVVKALISDGIPVMGHIGLLPQTAPVYKVRGKAPEEAQRFLQDAVELDKLGVFSMVLESMPESLVKRITGAVGAPTIGIGAGKYCDGQVLVINDMLGLDPTFSPKYIKRYANLNQIVKQAVEDFKHDVRAGEYPDDEHTYH
jgi:3-methyl-2-oxobutanoate hydroxymethyltransferase